jgi:hypothetical protein
MVSGRCDFHLATSPLLVALWQSGKKYCPDFAETGQKNIIPAHSRDGKLEKQQTAK